MLCDAQSNEALSLKYQHAPLAFCKFKTNSNFAKLKNLLQLKLLFFYSLLMSFFNEGERWVKQISMGAQCDCIFKTLLDDSAPGAM